MTVRSEAGLTLLVVPGHAVQLSSRRNRRGVVAVVVVEPGVGQEGEMAARHLYAVSELGRLLD
ncbi:hypothetical protein QFZ43_008807 [Streptomyces afghaniensis]|nr:hypothetical protein [Streptomyces afghaniensis]